MLSTQCSLSRTILCPLRCWIGGLFYKRPILGVIIGSAARYVVHVLAGVIFWAAYAPEDESLDLLTVLQC